MKRDEAIKRLQQHEADLKRLGVERLYLFGSTARDEANDDSDVDLFFDYEKGGARRLRTDGRKRFYCEHPQPQGRHLDA
jgi:predicted nucleotidyltransferase